MAYTQTDLDNLDAAIAQGAKVVHIEGRRVEYHSLDEMLRLRATIAAAVGAAAGAPSPPRQYRFSSSKGL